MEVGASWEGTIYIPRIAESRYTLRITTPTSGEHSAYGQTANILLRASTHEEETTLSPPPNSSSFVCQDEETKLIGWVTRSPDHWTWSGIVVQEGIDTPGTFHCTRPHAAAESTPLLLDLDDPHTSSLSPAQLGGKGYKCALLASNPIPTPGGSVVLARAYTQAMQHPSIAPLKEAAIAKLGAWMRSSSSALAAIQAAIATTPLSPELTQALDEWLESRGGNEMLVESGVAVRSSGVGEDGGVHSHAGVFDTVLNVRSRQGLMDAIRSCWASAWSSRAFSYLGSNASKVEAAHARCMAVVIMEMVPAAAAGVVFTSDPAAVSRPIVLLEAVHGLGEMLVSGTVTPASFEYDYQRQELLSQVPGDQTQALVLHPDPTQDGTLIRDVDPDTLPLTPEQAKSIAEAALLVARSQGSPQDMEWALHEGTGEILFLQTRPITTLSSSSVVPNGMWYPMLFDTLTTLTQSLQADGHSLLLLEWGQVVADWTPGPATEPALSWFGPRLCQLYTLPSDQALACIRFGHAYGRYGLYKSLQDVKVAKVMKPVVHAEIRDWLDTHYTPTLLPWARSEWANTSMDPGGFDPHTLFDALANYLEAARRSWASGYLAEDAVACARLVLGDQRAQSVLASVPSHTGMAVEALRTLADQIRDLHTPAEWSDMSDQTLMEYGPVAGPFAEFLSQWGWNSDDDQMLSSDTHWADHPGVPLATLRKLLLSGDGDRDGNGDGNASASASDASASEVMDDGEDDEEEEEEVEVVKKDGVVYYVKTYVALKEEIHVATSVLGYAVFRAVNRAGRAWGTLLGIEDSPSSIWSVPASLLLRLSALMSQVQDGEEVNARVVDAVAKQARAAIISAEMFRKVPRPSWLQPKKKVDLLGTAPDGSGSGSASASTSVPVDGAMFQGKGLSSGEVSGRAVVISSVSEGDAVEEGDVLVTHRTTAGWTPLFSRISGVVVESGGLLSHTAIVARELGIPVVCLKSATQLIPSWSHVVVNGDSGLVVVVPDDHVVITPTARTTGRTGGGGTPAFADGGDGDA